MNVTASSFEEVFPVWRDHLWPARETPIRSHSSMTFDGGYDPTIYDNPVHFYKVIIDDRIAGVNSVFKTGTTECRSRGLFVFPEFRGQGVSSLLLAAAVDFAKKQSAAAIWSLPRESALKAYERVGFQKIRTADAAQVEFGPNLYVRRLL